MSAIGGKRALQVVTYYKESNLLHQLSIAFDVKFSIEMSIEKKTKINF